MTDIQKKFNEIRDIKYQIPLAKEEPDYCCSGKMKMFKQWLDENHYQSRYRVCDFKWSDFTLPEAVTSLPHQDLSTHVYLEVYINQKWVDVDPTWDMALRNILPVNEWDGENDCVIAVPVLKKYSEIESNEIMGSDSDFDESDVSKNGKFYQAFNSWLEQNRN